MLAYIGQSGEYAVAGYGAGTRLEQVLLLPILGINTAIISIISQNFGANQIDRIKEAYFTSIKYSFFIMLISGLILYLFSDLFMSLKTLVCLRLCSG